MNFLFRQTLRVVDKLTEVMLAFVRVVITSKTSVEKHGKIEIVFIFVLIDFKKEYSFRNQITFNVFLECIPETKLSHKG